MNDNTNQPQNTESTQPSDPGVAAPEQDQKAFGQTEQINATQFNNSQPASMEACYQGLKNFASSMMNPPVFPTAPNQLPQFNQYPPMTQQMPPMYPMGFQQPVGMPPMGYPHHPSANLFPQAGMQQQPPMQTQVPPFSKPMVGSVMWQTPMILPVNTLDAGKVVLYVVGMGLTFFEGKDIAGICKVLNKQDAGGYLQMQGLVQSPDWYQCTLAGNVRILRFPSMTPNHHPASWGELWNILSQGMFGSNSPITLDQLKSFIWAEFPTLAKLLTESTTGAQSDKNDPVAEYFKMQQLQADRTRQA